MHAGLIQKRKSQTYRVVVSIYKAEEAGMCTEGGPYVTVCEAHGTLCNHESLRAARAHAPHLNWCEECQEKRWIWPSKLMTFYDFTKRNGEYIDRSFFYRTLMAKLRDFRCLKMFDTVEKRRAIAHKVMADEGYLKWRRGMIAFAVANDVVTDAIRGNWG